MPLSMVTLPCLCVDGKLLKIELEKGQFWPEQGNSAKKVCLILSLRSAITRSNFDGLPRRDQER